MFQSPRWCSCEVREGSSHLASVGCVCVDGSVERAVPQPLVATPRAASTASSHRTERTSSVVSYGIATPLGRTSRFSSPI